MTTALASLLDLLLPTACAGCGVASEPWCRSCRTHFGLPRPVSLPDAPPTWALARYTGPARRAVLAYKERGRRDLADGLAEPLARGLRAVAIPTPPVAAPLWLVPAPSRRSAARSRGGDHVLRLARRTAARLAAGGIPATVAPALRLTRGAADSVGLDGAARALNLAGHLRTRPAGLPPVGTAAVLLDDVVTTGATVRACVGELDRAGVRVGVVLVLASATPARGAL